MSKQPLQWLEIPDDVKKEVVNFLDYESRCHLKICSKADYRLVNSTKFIAKKIAIHETSSQMVDDKTIIRIDIDTLTIWFIGKENLTRIDRGWNGEIIDGFSDIKQKNRYELIGEFLEKISVKGIIRTETLEIDNLKLLPSTNWKLHVQSFTLIDVPHYHQWLQKLNPNLKRLQLVNAEQVGEEISRLKVTEYLNLYNARDVEDHHLKGVTATDVRIHRGKITSVWIKKALENHLKNGKRDDEFRISVTCPDHFDPFNYIPKSLIARRFVKEGYDEQTFLGKILGGYKNVNGVQDHRRLSIVPYSTLFSMICKLYKRPEGPFQMDPISDKYP